MDERRLWMRLGVSLRITEAEEAVIFGDDGAKAEELLRCVIAEDRFEPDGDTYIPAVTVEEYNQKSGPDSEDGDTDFNL